eukprot:1394267-Amphidinium_carterae.2
MDLLSAHPPPALPAYVTASPAYPVVGRPLPLRDGSGLAALTAQHEDAQDAVNNFYLLQRICCEEARHSQVGYACPERWVGCCTGLHLRFAR